MTERLQFHKQIKGKTVDTFTCQFNPTELTVGKTNNWDFKAKRGKGSEKSAFVGGAAQDITLKLLFDSTDTGIAITKNREYAGIKSLTEIASETRDKQTTKGEPPWVLVHWGDLLSFPAVITKFSEHYTLFSPDGAPLRSEVTITLKQIEDKDEKGSQNPTSFREASRTWLVQEGERLDWIAHEEYGDPSAWRLIAKKNGIQNPFRLRTGQLLELPPMS